MAKSCRRGTTKSGRCKRKPGPKRGSKSRRMRRGRRRSRRCKYGKLKQPVKTKSGGKRRCKKKRSKKRSRRKRKNRMTLDYYCRARPNDKACINSQFGKVNMISR